MNRNNLRLVYWNCNSLNNKIDEFKMFCEKFKPNIISLNETKMSNFRSNYMLKINNYSVIHKPRHENLNGGGGEALLVNNEINFYESILLGELNIEICAVM